MFYNENLYYLLRFLYVSYIWQKYIVPEIWGKMFSVNQIAVFLSELYHQNKFMKQHNFLHVEINSQKKSLLKIFWVGMTKIGCGKSDHGSLKLAVFQE